MRRYSKKQSELSILASHQKRFEKRWNWIFVVRDSTPKSKVNSQSTHHIKKNDLKKDGMGFLYCETFLQKSKVNWQSSHRIKNSFWKKMEWDFCSVRLYSKKQNEFSIVACKFMIFYSCQNAGKRYIDKWDLRLAMDISVVKFFQSQHPWLVRFLDLNKPGKRKLGYIELWG